MLTNGCRRDEAVRLRQVPFNLAGNAIKFTGHGGISIVVEPAAQSDTIAIAVRDTGSGISASDQPRIFLEFERAEGGASRKFSGTGLGLIISKRIVESMGGSIAVHSTPGQGSTFDVVIPPPRARATDEPPLAVPDLRAQDILIVAPAAIEASLIARRLQRWGRSHEDRLRQSVIARPWRQTALTRSKAGLRRAPPTRPMTAC